MSLRRDAATATLAPLERWSHQCHAASVALVRECAALGPCRVARGTCTGVGGQHSWVVLGEDCYAEDAVIVDPTLWSYDQSVEGVWVGSYRDGRHVPHGKGNIFAWGRPEPASGPVVELVPRRPWSTQARLFLEMLGPLDREGWAVLAHAPVEGWPAGEIIDAMCESGMGGWVPVDIVGMLTERNPGGVYLRTHEREDDG